ncbi:MAG: UDP-2,4-diacetamido-2,4,6-trideoxy-beta-L-altropyranose hydrolase, partial [Rhodospirillaceae bacterium]
MEGRRALFRFDAGPRVGGGHAMRCLTLAAALEDAGWSCRFAVSDGTLEAVAPLAARAGDCIAPDAVAAAGPVDALIVDHYGWTAVEETPCRKFADAILVLDDLADRPHDADILLDTALGRRAEDYAGLAPDACRYLLGPVYALLTPEFAALREATLARRSAGGYLRRALVAFGLTDPDDLTSRALDGLVGRGLEVTAVLGGGAPHLDAVRAAAEALDPPAELAVNAVDMAARMAAADVAIGAFGTTSWERCALGLPTVGVVAADNQRVNAAALTVAG